MYQNGKGPIKISQFKTVCNGDTASTCNLHHKTKTPKITKLLLIASMLSSWRWNSKV